MQAASSSPDGVVPLDFASAGGSWSINVTEAAERAGGGKGYAEREDPEALALALWNEGLKDDALAFVERQIALSKTLGEAAYVAFGPYAGSHSAPAALAIDADSEGDADGEPPPPSWIASHPEPLPVPAGLPAVMASAGIESARTRGWTRDRRLRPALIAGLFAGAALLLAVSMLNGESGAELDGSPDRLLAATDAVTDAPESASGETPAPAAPAEAGTPAWLSTVLSATGRSASREADRPAPASESETATVEPPAVAAAPEPDASVTQSGVSQAEEPNDGEVPAAPPASDAGATADAVDSLTVGSINPLPSGGLDSASADGGSTAAAEPRIEVLDSYPADPASAAVVDLPPEMLEPELSGAAAALESGPEVETAQPQLQSRLPSPRPEPAPALAALPNNPEPAEAAAVANDPEPVPRIVDLPPDAPVLLGRPLRPGLAARRLAAERYAARRRAVAEWNAAAEGGPVLLGRPGVR